MPQTHSVINHDGVCVYLPRQSQAEGLVNLEVPEFYAPTVAQEYPFGTRAVYGERVYRYGKASTDGTGPNSRLVQNGNIYNDDGLQDAWEGGSTAVATAVGDTTIIFADTNSNHIANFFRRGWIVMFYSGDTMTHQILSNTAAGTTMTLTLVDPVVVADGNGAIFSTIHPSIYSKMRMRAAGFSTQAAIVGYAPKEFTASYYGWIQTWGPCYVVATVTFGNAAYERMCTVAYDGSVRPTSFATAEQRVGHLLPQHEDDDSFLMLTISP